MATANQSAVNTWHFPEKCVKVELRIFISFYFAPASFIIASDGKAQNVEYTEKYITPFMLWKVTVWWNNYAFFLYF